MTKMEKNMLQNPRDLYKINNKYLGYGQSALEQSKSSTSSYCLTTSPDVPSWVMVVILDSNLQQLKLKQKSKQRVSLLLREQVCEYET